ncbi:MAG: carotenoid 1,2-hydratase [Burkholderiaceae bacterium]|nr:carotenoid 1,2-hydratase [Burkholderiaceae bacterium]
MTQPARPVYGLRRALVLGGPAALAALTAAGLPTGAAALPPRRLVFPRDHGAHPELRTEWWYITGHAESGGRRFGFQVTFFRSRVDGTQALKSRLAARQLLFAHAAITDLAGQRLWHDQRIAREGPGGARAATQDTDLLVDGWSLRRDPASGHYHARIRGDALAMDLRFEPTQALLLQGREGLSRKGPQPEQASYYYSLPQLAARGELGFQSERFAVTGKAWLDHEWSEALLHPDAVGWDWIGMNYHDGSALTAFRLRRRDGSTLWSGGSFRTRNSRGVQTFIAGPGEVEFSPQRFWTSPLSRARYPVEWIVRTPADFYTVRALLDAQEMDSRASTGALYWEGLSELVDSNGQPVGLGYLEMTGYAAPLRL